MSTLYRVVGIHILPKKPAFFNPFFIAKGGFKGGKSIFEKLVVPVEQQQSKTQMSDRKFSVVGIMEVNTTPEVVDVQMELSAGDSLEQSVIKKINSMVKTVH